MVPSIFDLNPSFKVEEFLAPNCAVERKLNFMLELIATVKSKEAQLRGSSKQSSELGGGGAGSDQQKANGKTKSVTFRQEDSIAGIPNAMMGPGGRPIGHGQPSAEYD